MIKYRLTVANFDNVSTITITAYRSYESATYNRTSKTWMYERKSLRDMSPIRITDRYAAALAKNFVDRCLTPLKVDGKIRPSTERNGSKRR